MADDRPDRGGEVGGGGVGFGHAGGHRLLSRVRVEEGRRVLGRTGREIGRATHVGRPAAVASVGTKAEAVA